MQYAASLSLLFDFVCFCAVAYQLSWSVTDADILGPAWRRVSQRTARRCYYLAFLLAFTTVLALIVHVSVRNVLKTWPEVTPLCLGLAGLLFVLALVLEFAVVRQF